MATRIGAIDIGGTKAKSGIWDARAKRLLDVGIEVDTPMTPDQPEFVEALEPLFQYFSRHDVDAVGMVAPPLLHYATNDPRRPWAELPYGVSHPQIVRSQRLPDRSPDDGQSYYRGGEAINITSMRGRSFDLRSAVQRRMNCETFASKDTVGNIYAELRVGVGRQRKGWDSFVLVIDGTGFGIGAARDGEVVPRQKTLLRDQEGNLVSPSVLRRLGQAISIQTETAGPLVPIRYGDLTKADDAERRAAARDIARKHAVALTKLDPDLGSQYVLTGGIFTRLLPEEIPQAYEEALSDFGVESPKAIVSPLGPHVGLIGAGEVAAIGLERLRVLEPGLGI